MLAMRSVHAVDGAELRWVNAGGAYELRAGDSVVARLDISTATAEAAERRWKLAHSSMIFPGVDIRSAEVADTPGNSGVSLTWRGAWILWTPQAASMMWREGDAVRQHRGGTHWLGYVAAGAFFVALVLAVLWMLGDISALPDAVVSGTVVVLAVLATRAGRARFRAWAVAFVLAVVGIGVGMGLIARFDRLRGIEFLFGCLLGILLGLPGANRTSDRIYEPPSARDAALVAVQHPHWARPRNGSARQRTSPLARRRRAQTGVRPR